MFSSRKKSKILPYLIKWKLADFSRHVENQDAFTLSFEQIDCNEWFNQFADKVLAAISERQYLPVVRCSDGEYKFMVGEVIPVWGGNLRRYLSEYYQYVKYRLSNSTSFSAATLPGVSSGTYQHLDWAKVRATYSDNLRSIAQEGILALHLTCSAKPFQEKYHFSVQKWFFQHNIPLNSENYYPFYFVYALLRGSRKQALFAGRRVLAIHGATGIKREAIIHALEREGIASLEWVSISATQSLFEQLDIRAFVGKVDLVLLGAGVGKVNVLPQLRALSVPCLDAGYAFEVWADEEQQWKRPMMVPDHIWDSSKICF